VRAGDTQQETEPGKPDESYLVMAKESDRDLNPQQAQRNGQSAISQDNPLRELHQEGNAQSDRPIGSALVSPELTDQEVSVLCDVERDGSTKSDKEPVVKSLIERGFIASSEEPLARVKLTLRAEELLSKRGVGLNES
jgi:hypothetical protein